MPWNVNFLGSTADAVSTVNALTGDNDLETAQLVLVKNLLKLQMGVHGSTTGSLFVAGPISLRAYGSMEADVSCIHIELQPVRGVIGGKIISGSPRQTSNATVTT